MMTRTAKSAGNPTYYYKLQSTPTLEPKDNLTPNKSIETPAPLRILDQRMILQTTEGVCFEAINQVVAFEANGNYTKIHLMSGQVFYVTQALNRFDKPLANTIFLRVHRSFIINLDLMTTYTKGKAGYIVMDNSMVVNIAVSRKKLFTATLEKYFV